MQGWPVCNYGTPGLIPENALTTLSHALALAWIANAGLDKALLKAVKGGAKVTILAPDNRAFKRLRLKCNVKNVLLDHVIPQLLPASAVLAAPEGFQVRHW